MGAEPPVHEVARLVLLTRTKIKAKVARGQSLYFCRSIFTQGQRLRGGRVFTFADQFLLEVGSGCRCDGVPISCKMRV